MQWTMMLWALENKSRTYNFMGTPISDDTDTQMGGVYRFKKGFNARKVIYAGEFTKVFNRFGWNLLQCGIKARSAIRKTIERLKNL